MVQCLYHKKLVSIGIRRDLFLICKIVSDTLPQVLIKLCSDSWYVRRAGATAVSPMHRFHFLVSFPVAECERQADSNL
jgi:hypothetical protein